MPEEHRRMSLSPAPPPPLPSGKHGARGRAALVDDVRFDAHRSTGYHPERPERLLAARRAIDASAVDWARIAARPASDDELARAHDPRFIDELEKLRGQTVHLDPDTYVAPDSIDAARLAAGGLVALVDAVIDGPDAKGVALLRPPGHHARPAHAMGFCLFNNVAVAAAHARARGVERVLIVDWDVHHGNGTQAMFWDEPAVLYVSTHQSPFYPGTGAGDEVGGFGARGLTVNVPLPPGTTGNVVRRALDEVAAPVIDAFGPTWVLVSAGFDAHRADPLADLSLSSGDFADLARTVSAYAPQPGRVAVFLEGGYDLEALRSSVAATLGALTGVSEVPGIEPPTAGGNGVEAVIAAAAARARALGG